MGLVIPMSTLLCSKYLWVVSGLFKKSLLGGFYGSLYSDLINHPGVIEAAKPHVASIEMSIGSLHDWRIHIIKINPD